ncbi:MAG TPA: DUF998 domain-containing protein [Thermoplasmata archaeon]|nr:DUF998 domain-containing protein [Thermoplasmata archaeon]
MPRVSDPIRSAGVLAIAGAVEFIVGLFVAESIYPGYHVGANPISDLGATCRPDVACVVQQPASILFTGLMLTLGALVLAAGVLLQRYTWYPGTGSLLMAGGLGILGAGVFSEQSGLHALFALAAFFFPPVAALLGLRLLPPSLRSAGAALAALSLGGLGWQLLGSIAGSSWFGPLGDGGVERVIVYPVLLWLLLLGVSLVAGREDIPWSVSSRRPSPASTSPPVSHGRVNPA